MNKIYEKVDVESLERVGNIGCFFAENRVVEFCKNHRNGERLSIVSIVNYFGESTGAKHPVGVKGQRPLAG